MRHDDTPLSAPDAADRPASGWICGRRGDCAPCVSGPSTRGKCLAADACVPRRTWHSRCRRAAIICLGFVALALGCILMSPDMAAVVFKPGELSTPHAQILSQSKTSARCAACHGQASLSPSSWFRSAGDAHDSVSQTDRCLDCHHVTIAPARARLAHGLSPDQRRDIRAASVGPRDKTWHDLLPSSAASTENIQCAACHREHRGRQGELLAVSDAQCQTCHADRFDSFAGAHPDWNAWPYGRGGEIAFDHAAHAAKHYPATHGEATSRSFDCQSCHRRTASGEIDRSPSYEQACRRCHDESLRLESARGFPLIALPTLPAETTDQLDAWPELAAGLADGQLAGLTELMLRSDRSANAAVSQLTAGDFSRIDTGSPEVRRAMGVLAKAHHRVLKGITTEGHPAILHRLEASGIPVELAEPLVRSLPPQLVEDAYRRWFGSAGDSAADSAAGSAASDPGGAGRPSVMGAAPSGGADDSLLAPAHRGEPSRARVEDRQPSDANESAKSGDALLLVPEPADGEAADVASSSLLGPDTAGERGFGDDDPLSLERLAAPQQEAAGSLPRFDAAAMLPAGGWYRDDVRMAIRYRAAGHADPVLMAVIEMLRAVAPGDPARQRMLRLRSIRACMSCHPAAASAEATSSAAATWQAQPRVGRSGTFTKFSHRPHLNIEALADCSHCHALRSPSSGMTNFVSTTAGAGASGLGHGTGGDFAPLERDSCAACHTAQAAGNRCTQCHRYHVDADRFTLPSR